VLYLLHCLATEQENANRERRDQHLEAPSQPGALVIVLILVVPCQNCELSCTDAGVEAFFGDGPGRDPPRVEVCKRGYVCLGRHIGSKRRKFMIS